MHIAPFTCTMYLVYIQFVEFGWKLGRGHVLVREWHDSSIRRYIHSKLGPRERVNDDRAYAPLARLCETFITSGDMVLSLKLVHSCY